MKCQTANHYTIQTLVLEEGEFEKVSFMIKTIISTNPSLPQIEMIDIGHKSLPINIGPYEYLYAMHTLLWTLGSDGYIVHNRV